MQLFIPYYIDAHESRRKELDTCIKQNHDSGLFSKITIFIEHEGHKVPSIAPTANWIVYGPGNLPYHTAIAEMLKVQGEWRVLANTDILFGASIKILDKLSHNQIIALTRWENDTQIYQYMSYSQDVWAFPPNVQNIQIADKSLLMGTMNCDNMIAYYMKMLGWKVKNPCHTIRVMHQHASGVRHYSPVDNPNYPRLVVIQGFLTANEPLDCIKKNTVDQVFPPEPPPNRFIYTTNGIVPLTKEAKLAIETYNPRRNVFNDGQKHVRIGLPARHREG